jgi:hypothetical protein
MQHKLVYEALITKARLRDSVSGYVEKHHILPRSLGGDDSPKNIVSLTAREHFIAHMLLAHIHGGSQWYAVIKMSQQCGTKNSRSFEYARQKAISYLKSRKITWGKKISIANTGKVYGSYTSERCQNISAASMGRVITNETKQKIINSLRGKKHSPETKLKMKLARQAYWANKKDSSNELR